MALLRSNLGSSWRDARRQDDPRLASLRAAVGGAPARSETASLDGLRQAIRKLEQTAPGPLRGPPSVPFGVAEIDARLTGGGLACGAVHQIAPQSHADLPAAIGFTIALGVRALGLRPGMAVLVMTRRALQEFGAPYGHGLAQFGLDPGRLLVVETRRETDALWSLEETLRAMPPAAVVLGLMAAPPGLTPSRRLNLAAAVSRAPLLLAACSPVPQPNAALTRWSVAASPLARASPITVADLDGLPRAAFEATLARSRNGRTGTWTLRWDHAAHRFHLASVVADRTPDRGRAESRGPLRLVG